MIITNNYENTIRASMPFTPEQAGYSPERLALLDHHYHKLIEDAKMQEVRGRFFY